MNVYDAAHNLANALRNSNEYDEFDEKRKKVMKDPKNKEMIEDFRKRAMEIQMSKMAGKEIEEEKINSFKKLEEIVMSNPTINEFFSAEMRFSQMMNDVYKILGDSMELNLGLDK